MSDVWQSARSPRNRARTRCRTALAASILLHLLLACGLWLMLRGTVPAFEPVSDVAIDFALAEPVKRDDKPMARARAPDERLTKRPLRDHARTRQQRAPGGNESPGVIGSTAAAANERESAAGRGSADLPPSHHSVAPGDGPSQGVQERTIPSARGPAPGVNLSFDDLASDAKFRVLPAARGDPLFYPRTAGPRHRPGADELIAESERNDDAKENVRRGRAHPLLFEYLRGARTRLEPEATRLAEALPLGPGLSVQGWGRGYLGRLVDVAKGRSERDLPDSTIDNPTGGRHPDFLPAYDEAGRQSVAGAEQRTADVCLGVAPDRPVVVTLRRSSGHAALDQLALDAFQKVAVARPMATDIRPGLACYLVRISAFRVPPLPMLSFGIKNGKPDVVFPLKRLTKVTVELVSVDHGDDKKPRSLLHAR